MRALLSVEQCTGQDRLTSINLCMGGEGVPIVGPILMEKVN